MLARTSSAEAPVPLPRRTGRRGARRAVRVGRDGRRRSCCLGWAATMRAPGLRGAAERGSGRVVQMITGSGRRGAWWDPWRGRTPSRRATRPRPRTPRRLPRSSPPCSRRRRDAPGPGRRGAGHAQGRAQRDGADGQGPGARPARRRPRCGQGRGPAVAVHAGRRAVHRDVHRCRRVHGRAGDRPRVGARPGVARLAGAARARRAGPDDARRWSSPRTSRRPTPPCST